MKSILIIGYGKWARKILYFVQKNNLFNNIYIKKENQSYIVINNHLKKIKNFPEYKNIDLVHVCSPVSTHYKYLKIFVGHKNLIIEKPFLKNLNEFLLVQKMLLNKRKPVVNYIDLYNPLMNMLQKKIKIKCSKIVLEYSNTSSLFKEKYLCAEDWLEHPLSVVLFLFKKFAKFNVLHKTFIKKKNKYLEKIEIEYMFQSIKIIIRININNKSSRKIYVYNSKDLKFSLNLKNNKIISKGKIIVDKTNDDSLLNLYKATLTKKKKIFKSMLFYEKIIKERISIMKNLRNDQF
jgi:hypothetical protein